MQRVAIAAAPTAVPPVVNDVLCSPGEPLDARTRGFMEGRFGHTFAHVRIHTDARAAESAHAVRALAYTVGRDVVFGAGRYTPHTRAGQALIAHELAHVAQQGTGSARPGQPLELSSPQDAGERQAHASATAALAADQRVPFPRPVPGRGTQVQRADDDAGTPTVPITPSAHPWDPEITLFIFLEGDQKDCGGGADRDGVITLYSRCGSPVKPPFCQSAHSHFTVFFRIDLATMPRPSHFKAPTVGVSFEFTPARTYPAGGKPIPNINVSDNAPRYVGPGEWLEPKFGRDFPFDTPESGILKITLTMDDAASGNKVKYEDRITYDVRPCV